jgi:electron transport complex protein RnfB
MLALEPLVLAGLTALVAALLITARKQYPEDSEEDQVVKAINDCLPQTQCAQCGHPGCLPYAEAIANGEPINRCPPGGADTIKKLAELLGREAEPLDPEFGSESPKTVAVIREAECIGCTLCIQACPVDAIVGAQQQMHSVIADVCTGCDLCLPPCPVDCIDMMPVPPPPAQNIALRPLVTGTEGPCIRCGDCEVVCPKGLSPQNLHWQRRSPEAMIELRLDDCIECRLCDRACPSAIPLTENFIASKSRLAEVRAEQIAAAEAEARYNKRNERLAKAKVTIKTKPSSDDRAALLARLKK